MLISSVRSASVFLDRPSFRHSKWGGLFHRLSRQFRECLPNFEELGFSVPMSVRHAGSLYFIENDEVFELTYNYGHTYLVINGEMVCKVEFGIIEYIDDNGNVVKAEYSTNNEYKPVQRRLQQFLDDAQDFDVVEEVVSAPESWEDPRNWYVARGEKPLPVEPKGRLVTIEADFVSQSRKFRYYQWVEKCETNSNFKRRENLAVPVAYKVVLPEGVEAWLPSSLIKGIPRSLRYGVESIEVPAWWLKKQG